MKGFFECPLNLSYCKIVCNGNISFNACAIQLFHFQVDALTTERGKEGGWVTERLLNQVKQFLVFGTKKFYHTDLFFITK